MTFCCCAPIVASRLGEGVPEVVESEVRTAARSHAGLKTRLYQLQESGGLSPVSDGKKRRKDLQGLQR